MKSEVIKRIENHPAYQALQEARRKAEEEKTVYSLLIGEYLQTFVDQEELSKYLKIDPLTRYMGYFNPSLKDIVEIEERWGFRLIDMLNWGKQMGYEV
jgi:hypothetical protein